MSELKSRLPGKPKQEDVDAFISGADVKTKASATESPEIAASITAKKKKSLLKVKQPPKNIYPWEEATIRDDVVKVYNLRLPEAYLLKLKYISDNTPDSMQKFCLQVVLSAIDEKIAELGYCQK